MSLEVKCCGHQRNILVCVTSPGGLGEEAEEEK